MANYIRVSRECFIGGSHICDGEECSCVCHTEEEAVARIDFTPAEITKLKYLVTNRLRHEEQRIPRGKVDTAQLPAHNNKVSLLQSIQDKLEAAAVNG